MLGHKQIWTDFVSTYDIIIIINLITLLNIYLLGNIHLSQIVGGIRLSKEKEIHLP
jgi:hypothetical protein